MSKILIEGNKVIIDGHANDLETCNTLTNLCDELSKSEKFRTVKYESGYGEFESVSECGEKKFEDPDPINGYQVNIQSNDGATILAQNNSIDSVVVTSNGAQLKRGYTVIVTYTYSGSKLFAGLATSANATAPKYKPGDTIAITAETALYIVENIIIPDHHSSLTELFTNIAAVIRNKTGSTEPIIADAFPTAIDAIPSGGGGYIEELTLQNESFGFRVNDVRFNACSFIQAIVHIFPTSSNVSFTNCVFRYSQIMCTQSIRDAIESDSSNIIEDVEFNIIT